MTIKLIIFDCDGVLVDSEMLSSGVLMQMMAEIDLPITPEIFRSDFLGRSFAMAAALTEKRHGRPMPPDFQLQYRTRLLAHMRNHLEVMPGTLDMLRTLTVPYALATSSSPERLAVSLSETGLNKFFMGRTYTTTLVPNGKPHPDIFFHVAAIMNTKPENCLVIEDSEMGLRAGLSAGMTVWRFVGGIHLREHRELPDDVKPHRTIETMTELQKACAELGLCTIPASAL